MLAVQMRRIHMSRQQRLEDVRFGWPSAPAKNFVIGFNDEDQFYTSMVAVLCRRKISGPGPRQASQNAFTEETAAVWPNVMVCPYNVFTKRP